MFWRFFRLVNVLNQLVYTMFVHQNIEKNNDIFTGKKFLYHPQGNQAVLVTGLSLHQS